MSRRIAVAVALIIALAAAPVLARPACQTESDLAAMQFRQLQVEFMVAALKCDGAGYDYRGQYAAYMHKAGPELARNARILKAMFVRQGKGAGYIDRYMTGMSNDVQIRSQSDAKYCETAALAFEHAAALTPRDLPAYAAQTVGKPYAATPCPARPVRAAAHRHVSRRHTAHGHTAHGHAPHKHATHKHVSHQQT